MKNIFVFTITSLLMGSLVFQTNQFHVLSLLSQDVTQQSYLLFQYGIMIGYVIFILFIFLLQLRNYYQLIHYKPLLGKTLLMGYLLVAIGFSIGVFIQYQFQKSIILALSFLIVTAVFDTVRDKLMLIAQGNMVYPKKIL